MTRTSFETWMEKVDEALEQIVGLSSLDLPDIDYYSLYESGVSPRRAARRAIKEAGGEDLL
jgi:hypothetical protein